MFELRFLLAEFDFFTMWGRATPLILAIVPSLLAVTIFFVGKSVNRPQVKTVSYVILALGVLMGIFAAMKLQDTLYPIMHDVGPRSQMLFYAIGGVPLIVAVALFIFDRITGGTRTSGL